MSTSAQIKYFPNVFYDIDEDGIEDISINYHLNSYGYYTVDAREGTEIEFAINGGYVVFSEFNDTIRENLNWQPNHAVLYSNYERKPKEWKNSNYYYFIGIRVKKDGAYYYGWIRFNSKIYNNIGRDFAIQAMPDKPIKAGEGVESITPVYEKAYNNKNSLGLNITFFPPYQSSYVDEYRLYIVKCSKANELNINTLLSVPDSNFQVVASRDYKYNIELNAEMLTIDNDSVFLSEYYQICVLAYSNKTDSFPHSYVLSDTVAINISTVSVEIPAAFDTGDNGDSNDIQIKFKKSSNESFLKEYKLMILPADSVATFNLKKANSVQDQFAYIVTPPLNDSLYTIENIQVTDIYGSEIVQNKSYNIFILSVHDEVNTNRSSLSLPSNLFVLNNPSYIYAGQTEGDAIISIADYNEASLDFDNDENADITVQVNEQIESPNHVDVDVVVFPGENTEIIYSYDNLAKKLAENTPVFSNSKWSSDTLQLSYKQNTWEPVEHIEEYGEFCYWRAGIIGFRKVVEGNTIYGWAGICCGQIKRYGLQNYSKLLFIESIDDNDFMFYPNPNSNRILNIGIKKMGLGKDNYIDILNVAGTVINSYRIEERLVKISIANLHRGLYFVRLRMADKQVTNKLIVL